MGDTRTRKWQITINNPTDNGYTHDKILSIVHSFKNFIYYCLCDETGEQGTPHTHLYVQFENAKKFSTMKNKFPKAHIEMVNGTAQENRDYIRKEGKYMTSEKKETNHIETFYEYGEMPIERKGARNDLEDLKAMIYEGLSDKEILDQNGAYMLHVDKFDKIRQAYLKDKYKDIFRNLKVSYIYGNTGTGKTRIVMEFYGYKNVYRVTDYLHPFDNYESQEVVLFDEYRTQFKISDLLNYLDGYPLELPCRYNNKIACYETVYIISNVPIEQQYTILQDKQIKSYEALIRRINDYYVFLEGDIQYFKDYQSYKKKAGILVDKIQERKTENEEKCIMD